MDVMVHARYLSHEIHDLEPCGSSRRAQWRAPGLRSLVGWLVLLAQLVEFSGTRSALDRQSASPIHLPHPSALGSFSRTLAQEVLRSENDRSRTQSTYPAHGR